MSKDKIELFAPWEWEEMNNIIPGQEPQGTTIMSIEGSYVCHQFNILPIEKRQELASCIVSAVNNTYGQSINPEAVKEMYDVLKSFVNSYKGVNIGSFKILDQAKAAIEKAKL